MNITMRLQKAGITTSAYHAAVKSLSRMDLVTLKK